MTIDLWQLQMWLDKVSLPEGLEVRAGQDTTDALWFQIRDPRLEPKDQGGAKNRVSLFACEGEVVQACLKATLAWFEHEVREQFLWEGRPIFHPHADLAALWTTVAPSCDVRTPA
jgi:hypothetical protein